MKNLIRLGTAILSFMMVFSFFACSNDTEEDDELVVEFTVSGSETDTSRKVTMKAPANYADKDIKIVYTLDGSKPELSFKKENYKLSANIAEYIDYGTASLYEEPVVIGESLTINAIAFYVDVVSETCVKGSAWTSKTINVGQKNNVAETSTATGASSGNFTFTLAETGNSNTTHYFDTYRTNVFKLNDEHPRVYYQTQFSWKGNGKGNWYLYMRDLNGPLVKAADDTNFLAKGSYTGNCFNDTKGKVSAGELILVNGENASSTGTISISSESNFILGVNNSNSAAGTLGTFTVGDAK